VPTFRSQLDQWRAFGAVLAVAIVIPVLVSACSDDPVLGPSDGESEEGGSYSVIENLARPDTAVMVDSTAVPSTPKNPERF
jgi:hypothetical protein